MSMPTRDCPSRLYKYFGPERIDILERGIIRYSPLGAFNDPFEGRPEITNLSTEADLAKTFADIFPRTIEENYALLPPQAQKAIPLESFKSMLMTKFQTTQNEFFRQVQTFTPLLKTFFSKKFDEHIGALCLSEVPDSLLMWSHYGASHTGFVVEFDAHHQYFHEQRSTEDELRHLRRVLYRETRPSAPLTDLGATELFFVKSGHWAYEREWRILRALIEADQTIPCEQYPISLFNFPLGAVTAVILGARISKETEERLRTALRSMPAVSAAKLKRATPDQSHFLLRIKVEPQ